MMQNSLKDKSLKKYIYVISNVSDMHFSYHAIQEIQYSEIKTKRWKVQVKNQIPGHRVGTT